MLIRHHWKTSLLPGLLAVKTIKMLPFRWNNELYSLGLSVMDDTHKEFIELYNTLLNSDDVSFTALFNEFSEHIHHHFNSENELMEQSCFPAISEHKAEHQRVLNDLKYLESKVKDNKLSFSRFYIKERIPEWFKLHLATMDSALAAHLKSKPILPAEKFHEKSF